MIIIYNRKVDKYTSLLDLQYLAIPSINHDILISCLSSWFGYCGSVLSWFESYLSSRSFCVKCDNHLCSLYYSSCGVPQGSVLGPLLFIMYTTPSALSSLPFSLNHYLYADNTQLFFSFYPSDFDSNITHLQDALQQISSWMTVSFLTINSSKTEFLLIGLSKQLAKVHNSSLSITHSAHNLDFIFDKHLSFSDQISTLSLNLAIITSISFVASILTSTSKQTLPLPPPSYTPNLTMVTLFTTIYQSLK